MSGFFDFSPEAPARPAGADVARTLAEDVGAGLARGGMAAGQARASIASRESAVFSMCFKEL